MSESIALIAGVIADAVREGISRTLNTQQPSQSGANVTSSGTRQPATSTPSSLYQRVSTIPSGSGQHAVIPSRTQSAPSESGDNSDATTGRDMLYQQCFAPNVPERMILDPRLLRTLETFSVSPKTARTDLEVYRYHEAPAEVCWQKAILVFGQDGI